MKHYLFIIPSLTTGGAERVVSVLANGLVHTGRKVSIIIYYDTDKKYSVDKLVEITNLSRGKEIDYLKMPYSKRLPQLRRIIKKIRPDVIIPFLPQVCAQTVAAVPEWNRRIIQTIRNNPEYSPSSKKQRKLRDMLVRFSKITIVQNEQQKEYFSRSIQKKLFVLHNPAQESFLKKKWLPDGEYRVVAAGRLNKQKNFSMLIEAFSEVVKMIPDAVLEIYGEGELKEQLQEEIVRIKMQDHICLKGRTEDLGSILQKASLFILSSNYEGMPNVLMEAMAVGLPCISTNCRTGVTDLIDNKKNGLLVPVNDKKEMSEAIINVLTNKQFANSMGMSAKFKIEKSYKAEVIVKNLIEICER